MLGAPPQERPLRNRGTQELRIGPFSWLPGFLSFFLLSISLGCCAKPTMTAADGAPQFAETEDAISSRVLPLPKQVAATYTQENGYGTEMMAESIVLRRADDEGGLDAYAVYWADLTGERLGWGLAEPLAVFPATGGDHTLRLPPATEVPSLARYVLACSRDGQGEYCGPRFELEGRVLYRLRPVDVGGTVAALAKMVGALDDLRDCPGLSLATTCGDLACSGEETAESCPSDCSTYQLASYNYQTLCREVTTTFTPTTVEEIQYIVRNAAANRSHVKVKAGGHSANDVMCTKGEIIDVNRLNRVLGLEVFEGQETVSVETAVRMIDLGEWLDARGRSIGYTHLGFNYTTVGGTIATSSHGSSAEHGSILSQRLQSLDVVGADGELRTYTRETTERDTWQALTTHLGLLGVVVRARIRVEPQFNLHARLTFHEEEALFDGTFGPHFIDVVKGCDFGQVNWFPGLGRFTRTCAVETAAPAEEGAQNTLLYPEIPERLAGPTKRLLQAGACDPENGFDDLLEQLRLTTLFTSPPFVKQVSGVRRHTTDVIGPSHHMLGSPLTPAQAGFFQMDWEVVVPQPRMDEAMAYIRTFVRGDNVAARRIRLPLVAMFLRFSKIESDSLMAYEGAGGPYKAGEYGLHIEMPIYVPIGFSATERAAYMAPFHEYVTALITRFDGRGHWGKNRDFIFPLEVQSGSFDWDDHLARFKAVVHTLDPHGLFGNSFAAELGISYTE